MTITSEIFIAVFAVALAGFAFFLTKRVRYVLVGQPEDRSDQVGKRTSGFLVYVLGQKKLFKEPVGILHFFIFWGFIVIAFGALQIIGEGLYAGFSLPLLGGWPVFYLLQDVFIVLVLVAVVAAAIIRYVARPERLEASLEAGIILALIFGIMVAGLLYSALTYALEHTATHAFAPATQAVASVAESAGWSESALHTGALVFWWLHVLFMLAFLVYIPLSKHLHLLACPVNEFFRNLKPAGGQIRPLDLEDEDVEEYGVSRIEGFTRWQLLDLYACAECGRCQDHCPAHLSGKSLSPKTLMTKLKDHLNERGPVLAKSRAAEGEQTADDPSGVSMIGDVITEDEIWACTTCYSCQEQCPVQNEHVNKIVDMRRSLVLDLGEFPQEAQLTCRNVEKNSNPWGVGAQTRADWAKDLDVTVAEEAAGIGEYLFWVGCAGSFDDRAAEISQAVVKLLRAAGVTSRSSAPRELQRRHHAAHRQRVPVPDDRGRGRRGAERPGRAKIVTQCPHCLNTLKNEYPEFGGDFEVVHPTELVDRPGRRRQAPLSNGPTRSHHLPRLLLPRALQGRSPKPPRNVLGGSRCAGARRCSATAATACAAAPAAAACGWRRSRASGSTCCRVGQLLRDIPGRHRRQLPVLLDDDGGRPRERRSGQGRPCPRPRRDPGRAPGRRGAERRRHPAQLTRPDEPAIRHQTCKASRSTHATTGRSRSRRSDEGAVPARRSSRRGPSSAGVRQAGGRSQPGLLGQEQAGHAAHLRAEPADRVLLDRGILVQDPLSAAGGPLHDEQPLGRRAPAGVQRQGCRRHGRGTDGSGLLRLLLGGQGQAPGERRLPGQGLRQPDVQAAPALWQSSRPALPGDSGASSRECAAGARAEGSRSSEVPDNVV